MASFRNQLTLGARVGHASCRFLHPSILTFGACVGHTSCRFYTSFDSVWFRGDTAHAWHEPHTSFLTPFGQTITLSLPPHAFCIFAKIGNFHHKQISPMCNPCHLTPSRFVCLTHTTHSSSKQSIKSQINKQNTNT